MFDMDKYELKMTQVMSSFAEKLKKIRTGRAHASMLDGVKVEAYGTEMPLNQVANVTVPEAQMLLVTPFDPSNIAQISNAIKADQTSGFNPSDDGRVVRVPVPALTEERRKSLAKVASEKVEEARIGMRAVRHDALKDAKAQKDAKTLSEDDLKMVEKEIDVLMKKYQSELEEAYKQKEKDIMSL